LEKLEEDMKPKLIGETWRKYPTETSKQKRTFGVYECQYCGTQWECAVPDIKTGHTKGCGCLRGGKPTHRLCSNKFYNTWNNMIQRCTSPNHKAYKDYGARGITICGEWQDVKNFVDWAEKTYPNIEGYTLDRIDNDKGYSPENCRWADKTTQAINQRRMKNNKSGYVGVVWYIRDKKWYANIRINKILKQIGSFLTIEEAVQARDNYIIENNLPHKLSKDYKRNDNEK
jgi:hypothetical protein